MRIFFFVSGNKYVLEDLSFPVKYMIYIGTKSSDVDWFFVGGLG